MANIPSFFPNNKFDSVQDLPEEYQNDIIKKYFPPPQRTPAYDMGGLADLGKGLAEKVKNAASGVLDIKPSTVNFSTKTIPPTVDPLAELLKSSRTNSLVSMIKGSWDPNEVNRISGVLQKAPDLKDLNEGISVSKDIFRDYITAPRTDAQTETARALTKMFNPEDNFVSPEEENLKSKIADMTALGKHMKILETANKPLDERIKAILAYSTGATTKKEEEKKSTGGGGAGGATKEFQEKAANAASALEYNMTIIKQLRDQGFNPSVAKVSILERTFMDPLLRNKIESQTKLYMGAVKDIRDTVEKMRTGMAAKGSETRLYDEILDPGRWGNDEAIDASTEGRIENIRQSLIAEAGRGAMSKRGKVVPVITPKENTTPEALSPTESLDAKKARADAIRLKLGIGKKGK